jgi:acetyltransferase-like isoleucine patch superfamily enzyme
MKPSLLIVGGGGHGKVVADAAMATGAWKRIAFLDNHWHSLGRVLGLEMLGANDAMERLRPEFDDLLVALGDNDRRMDLLDRGRAAVNPAAEIGRGVIINTGAAIEHDCRIGDGGQVSPGACMGGEARLGAQAFLGINASVLPKVSVGEGTTVGAGAAVIRDLPRNVVATGVPARVRGEVK